MSPESRSEADESARSVPGDFVYRGPDRRSQATPRLSRYSLHGGRRRGPRRKGEVPGSFVDLYEPGLLGLVVWIAGLNVLDSFYTLYHLQAGGIELNPVAGAMLQSGRVGFVVWKSVLIGLALIVLCIHKNFGLARLGLAAAATIYTLLVGYHVFLLGRH